MRERAGQFFTIFLISGENILSWIPFTGEEKVLEIGSGCGAVTGALCERAKEVTCIELSMKRSKINAYRHQDQDNLKILVGNFQEIEKNLTEKYDYITLIGVFAIPEILDRQRSMHGSFIAYSLLKCSVLYSK